MRHLCSIGFYGGLKLLTNKASFPRRDVDAAVLRLKKWISHKENYATK